MAITKQWIFGIDSEQGLNNTFSWDGLAANNNTDGKAITCAYMPRTKGNNINVLSEELLIGGLGLGAMWRTFMRNEIQDDDADFEAEAITNNLDPMAESGGSPTMNRFTKAEFPRTNPYDCDNLTVSVALDAEKPEIVGASYAELDHVTGTDIAGIPSGLGKSITLRILDTGCTTIGATVFDGLTLHYYPIGTRTRED